MTTSSLRVAELTRDFLPGKHPLRDTHFFINLHYFDDEYRILVRKDMRVNELIERIKDKFANDIDKGRTDYRLILMSANLIWMRR
jgi:hypothetical protein